MPEQADRLELLGRVPLLRGLPTEALERLARSCDVVRVQAREVILEEGETGECLYVVVSGRLEVLVDGTAVRTQGRGEVIGELALLTGERRSATVRAVRDSELLALARPTFLALLEERPGVATGLVEVLAERLPRSATGRAEPARRGVVAVVGEGGIEPGALRERAEALGRELTRHTTAVLLDETSAGTDPGHALDRAEVGHDVVLLLAERDGTPWADFCRRQADRLLDPARDLCDSSAATLARTARRLAGRSVGVVLSGGGARGLAHVGVVTALQEHGVVVDRWGGTSMGALVAAAFACGQTGDQVGEALRRELVHGRPFRDLAVPRHGLIRTRSAERMLARVLGGRRVEELDLPYFCVSCDLLTATEVVHRDGPLAEVVGASMRIPGVAPPLAREGRLLVDGGVLNNLPVDVMRADDEGPVVAVDVMRPFAPASALTTPGLLETVGRSMVLGSWQKAARNRALADLLVTPELGEVGMFEWRRLDELVELGRRAAGEALSRPASAAGLTRRLS